MPKPNKSSASSGTRKKHAKKRDGPAEPPVPTQKTKGGKKATRNEPPRPKAYIAPIKPTAVRPDPLETSGLAHSLPSELLVVLRNLGKKAVATKSRALAELHSGWIEKASQPTRPEDHEGDLTHVLVEMIPVWLHHIPNLFTHPSRRIRSSASSVHLSFLKIPETRAQILFSLREVLAADEQETILATWLLLTSDIAREVSSSASQSWTEFVSIDKDREENEAKEGVVDTLRVGHQLLSRLVQYAHNVVLDPLSVYMSLNPAQPAAPPPPPGSKNANARRQPQVAATYKDDTESAVANRAELEEESEQDRSIRLRSSALGAIRWLLESSPGAHLPADFFDSVLASAEFWTCIHSGSSAPYAAAANGLGFQQPVVRRVGWTLVQALLQHHKDAVQRGPALNTLSNAILRSAWIEDDNSVRLTMWRPLLVFLKEFPNAWNLVTIPDTVEEDASDDDEEVADAAETSPILINPSYSEFLQFLQLGCGGAPAEGYPTILIILSTIPSAVMTTSGSHPLESLFAAFWAAVDAKALNSLKRSTMSESFLSSLLECVVFLARRASGDADPDGSRSTLLGLTEEGRSTQDRQTAVRKFVGTQFKHVWDKVESEELKVRVGAASTIITSNLAPLRSIDTGLFDSTWTVLADAINHSARKATVDTGAHKMHISALVTTILCDTQHNVTLQPDIQNDWRAVVEQVLAIGLGSLSSLSEEGSDAQGGQAFLAALLDALSSELFLDEQFARSIDGVIFMHCYALLERSTPLLHAYFATRGSQEHCLRVWQRLVRLTATEKQLREKSLDNLLSLANGPRFPAGMVPESNEFDSLVESTLQKALSGSSRGDLRLAKDILQLRGPLLSAECYENSTRTISSTFVTGVEQLLHDDSDTHLSALEAALDLMTVRYVDFADTHVHAFILGRLLSLCDSSSGGHIFSAASLLWEEWRGRATEDEVEKFREGVVNKLKAILVDVQSRPSADQVLMVLEDTRIGRPVNLFEEIFADQADMDRALEMLDPNPIDPSVAVFDSLIPSKGEFSGARKSEAGPFDALGFSSYARQVHAMLQVILRDRQLAKKNVWAVRHFIALSLYAEDARRVPTAESGIFKHGADDVALAAIVEKVRQVSAYLLTTASIEDWKVKVTEALVADNSSHYYDPLSLFLVDTLQNAVQEDVIRECRTLGVVLEHLLADASKNEAEAWVKYARHVERQAPRTAMTVISSVCTYAPEPSFLERYRNELAASLMGLPPAKANKEGLMLLRKLAASAPREDSDIIFLPQHRAVQTVKTCQTWISSDEDIDEEVESVMTAAFIHLVPILQHSAGSHWDLIFDVIENNLENCSISDGHTLVMLARSLRLTIAIEDLASTNKTLRADWEKRKTNILRLIMDMASVRLDSSTTAPQSVCRGLVLSIIEDIPSSLMDQDTLSKMCHLLTDSSMDVRKRTYKLLQQAARKRTEHAVIEAAVDSESTFIAQLPAELVDILHQTVSFDSEDGHALGPRAFSYFLGWMVLFDLFTDASLKVKQSYIDQLRKLDLVSLLFIPSILTILGLDLGLSKALRLDIWGVDEFYIDLYDGSEADSLPLLAAHTYYRGLLSIPSLIHTWIQDCKDRQLSTALTTYTSTHFSPVIIQSELLHLRTPEALTALETENLKVKVLSTTNEVSASYQVEEHQLEIKLKIPSDWPLHRIEVKDVKRVGVDENQWRAWIFGVQQMIWTQNGRIVDGLELFKKNVTLHFEGQVECAICYSIISAMDGTFPKKPCKTCKNRFHAACLYKWFNSSHSSSCPLCRSDIL